MVDLAEPASARRGVAVLSLDGDWQEVDRALGALLGHPVEALAGRPAHRRLFPDCAGRIDDSLRMLGQGPASIVLACAYRTPEGHGLWLELDLGLLPDDAANTRRALLQIRDAGAERRNQLGMAAAQREQEYWAYGISHDLRASLRAIEGYAQRLERNHAPGMDAEGREWLSRVRNAAAEAGGLIEAMLEFSRVTSQAHEDVPVDVSLLAEWAAVELQDAHPGCTARIDVQPGLVARGDERQLKRMFGHLLHNAWKFSPRDRIDIRVEGESTGLWTTLRIRDRGVGFDTAYADKLFVPFKRLHGAEQGAGHGLGLAIVHRIVERHGGRIRADSEPGAGSTFHIELPLFGETT